MTDAPKVDNPRPTPKEFVQSVLRHHYSQIDRMLTVAAPLPSNDRELYVSEGMSIHDNSGTGKKQIALESVFPDARGRGMVQIDWIEAFDQDPSTNPLAKYLTKKGVDLATMHTVTVGEHTDLATIGGVDDEVRQSPDIIPGKLKIGPSAHYVIGKKDDGTFEMHKFVYRGIISPELGLTESDVLPVATPSPDEFSKDLVFVDRKLSSHTYYRYSVGEINPGDYELVGVSLDRVSEKLEAYRKRLASVESEE